MGFVGCFCACRFLTDFNSKKSIVFKLNQSSSIRMANSDLNLFYMSIFEVNAYRKINF